MTQKTREIGVWTMVFISFIGFMLMLFFDHGNKAEYLKWELVETMVNGKEITSVYRHSETGELKYSVVADYRVTDDGEVLIGEYLEALEAENE